jgi:Flp pilus assembly pilin Flp
MILRFWTYVQSRLAMNERGATALEYGLIVAVITLTILVSLNKMGGWLTNVFNATSNRLI